MSKKVQIIKVPSSKPPTAAQPDATPFPRMPRMYLELLENKDKVKPSVVNKEYDPDEAATLFSWNGNANEPSKNQNLSDIDEESDKSQTARETDDEDEDEVVEEDDDDDDIIAQEDEEDDDDDDDDDADSSAAASSKSATVAAPERKKTEWSEIDEEEEVDERSQSSGGSSQSIGTRQSAPPAKKESSTARNRLLEMLEEDKVSAPPRLSDLEKRGEVRTDKTFANLNRYRNAGSEEEDELKRELLFKFELLKKSYKNVDIPEFTMHSDFQNMNRTYENTVRRVSLDSNVDQYKSLLIGGFMLIEFAMGTWLKFDMAGFTQQQIINMNQYERLLIELGEKSYVPGAAQWPVEFRLIGLILMNSVIFIISKTIMNKTGNNLVNMMNTMHATMNNNNNASRPKRKMKGPSVSMDDIPDE
jgi:hypothetical protein